MNTSISPLLFYTTINIHITFSLVDVWLPFIGPVSPWLFPVVIEFTSQDMTGLALTIPSTPNQSPLRSPAISLGCSKLLFAFTWLVYVIEIFFFNNSGLKMGSLPD